MAESKWEQMTWTKLGHGGYNNVYISPDEQYVLKIQLDDLDPEDTPPDRPERSVRLWNEINPELPAFIAITKLGKGWICPYISGIEPSDVEISNCVLDIFNRTGRIVTDASGKENFKKTPEGKVICIDIGFALQLEQSEQTLPGKLKRNKSEVSLKAWRNVRYQYPSFFQITSIKNPITVKTVKALLFIKNNRPDINDVSFLTPDLINQFANAYDNKDRLDDLETLDNLVTVSPLCSQLAALSLNDRSAPVTLTLQNPLQATRHCSI